MIIELIYSRQVVKQIYESISSAKRHPNLPKPTEKEEGKEGVLQLYDCLEEFKKSEQLDEDNKWYCSKCKEHVQATKSLEIYKTPPVLIISLKRFKAGKQKFSMYGGGGGKLSTLVNFPLDGLDMAPYIL